MLHLLDRLRGSTNGGECSRTATSHPMPRLNHVTAPAMETLLLPSPYITGSLVHMRGRATHTLRLTMTRLQPHFIDPLVTVDRGEWAQRILDH